ncbi:CBS domain-containing protein [Sinirhodobacter populi]|uniref:CBS domain-containing protein n=1 Tax=Paenirhodobacter populi TaxID=2306993 RepID=A0A443KML1_9RHOB|nr:HPP family protein [Sinirhodobacter populi]RWR34038.1 CBS domain-containing protein [Sinirhodobacter populi]
MHNSLHQPAEGWRTVLRRFGPQMGRRHAVDIVRSALGAGIAILLCAVALRLLPHARETGLFLVSGFAAMSVLLFVLPNSPLAQPWSAMVGMVVSTGVAITVLKVVPAPYADGIAVTLAIAAMLAVRALHPPAAGMALFCALEVEAGRPVGYDFVLFPVGIVTLALIVLAIVWNRTFGIHYPARPVIPTREGPLHRPRQRLTDAELASLLVDFNQSANIGAADLGRMIDAAQSRAAHALLIGTRVGDIMTPAPATIAPETPLTEIVRKLVALGVKSLPVTDSEGHLLGLVDERPAMARLARELAAARRPGLGLRAAPPEPEARSLMGHGITPVSPEDPVSDLLQRLSDHRARAIPVTRAGHLVGIVSRTDLVALLLSHAPAEIAAEAGTPAAARPAP